MTQCYKEYTRTETYRVCVGTYNVNGGKHYRSIAYKHQSLADWLVDAHKTHPSMYVNHNSGGRADVMDIKCKRNLTFNEDCPFTHFMR